MLEEHLVALSGVDVVSACDYHVFLAVYDKQVVIFVTHHDIAGAQSPAAQLPGRFLRALEIFLQRYGKSGCEAPRSGREKAIKI